MTDQTDGTTTHDETIETVRGIVKDAHIAMLTTVAADGRLVSRPMGVQDVDFDGDLWFFTDGDSDKVRQVRAGSGANVSFAASTSWLSVSGPAEVVTDLATITDRWSRSAEAWFPDGPTTPGVALVVVHGETAEYWEGPGRAATVLSLLKSKVKGERYDGGENETVRL